MPAKRLVKDFNWAKNFKMPFGKYQGKTLDDIASDDKGLRYLDFMRGEMGEGAFSELIRDALRMYLDDPAIQADVERLEDDQ